MNRYEEADDNLTEVFLNVVEKTFPQYQQFRFKLIYDLKKRISQGKITLASIELANPKIKFFSRDKIAVDGYDFLVIVDKKAWDLAPMTAKPRLIRHEMRHVFMAEDGSPKIIGHEIEDFYAEIEFNKDDPEWRRKLATVVADVYDQEKIMLKEGKKKEIIE
jgi:hypothetical protein